MFTNVKDKDKPEDRQGAVYKIKCCDCQATWIGETGSNLSTRLTEHKRATRNGDANNHTAEHHLQTKHQMDWDSATCITDYYQRLTLESWFTNSKQTPLNRSQQLPTPCKHTTNDLLTKSSETNYERMTGELTIWLTIDDCFSLTIDGSKRTNYITSLHSQ